MLLAGLGQLKPQNKKQTIRTLGRMPGGKGSDRFFMEESGYSSTSSSSSGTGAKRIRVL